MLNYTEFLNEGFQEVKNLIQKQYSKNKKLNRLDDDLLKRIISLDPTSKLEKDKTGKYSKWLIKLWLNDDETLLKILKKTNKEDDYKITDVLTIFNKKKKKIEKTNIFDYKSFNELDNAILNLNMVDISGLGGDIEKDAKNNDISVRLNSDKWVMLIPQNKKMACKYGTGTRWCTANIEHNAWDSYKDDPLYIFLDKENDMKPTYQFHFRSKQFMDINDKSIDIKKFFNENIDVYDSIFPNVKGKIDSRDDNINSKELYYMPKQYQDEFMSYFDNKLYDILQSRDLYFILDDMEKYRKYIGFDDYDIDIPNTYMIQIKDFTPEKLLEFLELEGQEDTYSKFYWDSGALIEELDEYGYGQQNIIILDNQINDECEQYRMLDDIMNDELKKIISNICKLSGLNIKLNTIDEIIRVFITLGIWNKIEENVYTKAMMQIAEDFEKLLDKETSEFPYFCDSYGMDINKDDAAEYISKHPDILTLEQMVMSTIENAQSTFDEDNFNNIKYSANYDKESLQLELHNILIDVESDLELNGNESEYLVGNEEIIDTMNFLRSKNLKIGDSITTPNKKLTIDKILDNGKLEVTLKHGVKTSKHQIKYNDIDTYLQQYQIYMEKKVYYFKDFINTLL